MISTLLLALGSGLLSTLHCWGMCGSLIAALHSGAPGPGVSAGARRRLTGLYHAGRLACYSLLGAAGGVEAAVCCLAIHHGVIPPTINYENPDPDCDLDYTPNVAKKRTVNVAISNNLGFGGHNASLVFKRL